jgi:hypothetical protein
MLTKLLSVSVMLLLLTSSLVMAQATTGRSIDDHLLIKDAEKNLGLEDEIEVIGTPYLHEKFEPGEIIFDKGTRNVVPIRYNIYKDWIEYQQNSQTYILDPDLRIKSVKYDENTFVVEPYSSKGKTRLGYFKVLDSGKVTLLSKQIVMYKEYQQAQALQSSSSPPKYTRTADQFYFKVGPSQPEKVDNIKSMIASFPDKQDLLMDYAKKEKISVRREDELRRLFAYYYSLQ